MSIPATEEEPGYLWMMDQLVRWEKGQAATGCSSHLWVEPGKDVSKFKLGHLQTLSSSSNNRIVPEKGFHRCQSFHCHTPRRHPGEYTCIMILDYLYIYIDGRHPRLMQYVKESSKVLEVA